MLKQHLYIYKKSASMDSDMDQIEHRNYCTTALHRHIAGITFNDDKPSKHD